MNRVTRKSIDRVESVDSNPLKKIHDYFRAFGYEWDGYFAPLMCRVDFW